MKIAIWASAMLGIWACGKHPKPSQGSAANESAAEPTAPPPAPTVKSSKKGDCRTDYAPRAKRDPNPMCKVDGGTFVMTDPASDKSHPASMTVKLSPYYIDQFEVTVAQVALYLNTTHDDDGFHVAGPAGDRKNGDYIRRLADGTYQAEPGTERFPFNEAKRAAAMRYCVWAGKALPTEPQWEFAARHDPATGKDLLYPWGDQFDGKRARCAHDLCPDGPDTNDPAPVGTYDGTNGHADGSSPWGVFDMAGNVAETVADCAYSYKPCEGGPCVDPPPHGPQPGWSPPCGSITRGGGLEGDRQLRTINRGSQEEGFRCARPAR